MASDSRLDRKIWGIAWPAILSNISIPLLGLVDSAVLGHLGSSRYLAAVAIGTALLSFLYWGFSFLRMGTTGLVARAEGAGDSSGSILILMRSAVLALVIAGLVLALRQPMIDLGLYLLGPQADLRLLATSYARIRILSVPAVLVTYTVVGWFIGRQNTRWPMVVAMATNLCNMGLDFLLVLALDLRSDGAAMATVIAEYLGCLIALVAVVRQHPRTRLSGLKKDLLDVSAYYGLLTSNWHLFLRTVGLLFAFAFFTAQGDNLGSEVLAANTLMLQLLMMAAYGMDGFAFAAEGLCGYSLGAADLAGFHQGVRRCALWTAVAAGAASGGLLLLQVPLVEVLSNVDSVQELMLRYFPWLIALPLLAGPAYLLDGVFIGAAKTRYMMRSMLFSLVVIYLPLWLLSRDWGNHGLWLAFSAFNTARGLSLSVHYRRLTRENRWLHPVERPRP